MFYAYTSNASNIVFVIALSWLSALEINESACRFWVSHAIRKAMALENCARQEQAE